MVEAGCVAGRLDVHPEIDDVDENLRVPLGLHVSTHQPEREPGFAVFGHEARNDRVERPLMRLEAVGMRGIERERAASVLKHEPEFSSDM
jgi:hypothetical protein